MRVICKGGRYHGEKRDLDQERRILVVEGEHYKATLFSESDSLGDLVIFAHDPIQSKAKRPRRTTDPK